MLNANGIIEGVYAKGKYTDVKIGGVYYRSWNPISVVKGQQVSFAYTEKANGQYTNRNIQGEISVVGGAAPVAQPAMANAAPAPAAPAPSVSHDAKQGMIISQNALGHATALTIELYKNGKVKEKDITSHVLENAGVFARAVMDGDFYKEPEFDEAPAESTEEKPF